MRLRARPDPEPRWLVVGLGNPEAEYGGTRHNVGADAVRALGERLGASFRPHGKVPAQVADTFDRPGGTPLSLVVPFGYMNDSGGPVERALAFYKAPHDRLIVCHDDLDLELGTLRLKRGGGHGGHNGLRSVDARTGSKDYVRVRLGIGRPPGRQAPADFVLRRFSARERDDVELLLARAGDAILDVVAAGLEPAQNRHHGIR